MVERVRGHEPLCPSGLQEPMVCANEDQEAEDGSPGKELQGARQLDGVCSSDRMRSEEFHGVFNGLPVDRGQDIALPEVHTKATKGAAPGLSPDLSHPLLPE